MLHLDDHWTWDSWFTTDDAGVVHAFFLMAPRSLGDPALRHGNARIGHAVSTDLRTWDVLPEALGPGPPGSWDDLATWTGSVVRAGDGTWWLFHTGVNRAEDGAVQRIGAATSTDLVHWDKCAGPLVEHDETWYEGVTPAAPRRWVEVSWRDPWVSWCAATGDWRMLVTARVPHGPWAARGVLGAARSDDLSTWEVLPPVSDPGAFGHLEVPQLVTVDGRHLVLFSAYEWANSEASARRRHGERVACTGVASGAGPAGPFVVDGHELLLAHPRGELYAGRIVDHDGGLWFLGFLQHPGAGPFVGALSDPVRVHVDARRLRLDEHDLAAAIEAGRRIGR